MSSKLSFRPPVSVAMTTLRSRAAVQLQELMESNIVDLSKSIPADYYQSLNVHFATSFNANFQSLQNNFRRMNYLAN